MQEIYSPNQAGRLAATQLFSTASFELVCWGVEGKYKALDGFVIFWHTLSMMTLKQLLLTFPNEDACRHFLQMRRWPNGVVCPRCGKKETVYALSKPWHWECSNPECRKGNAYRFSVIAGTVFENTKYPLRTWFEVLYTMLNSKKGVSSKQIERQVGCSYPTALYMCHRLRAGMADPEFKRLMGVVEVDETFVGGKEKNKHRSKRNKEGGTGGIGSGKTGVVGAISRKGNVVCV